MPPKEGQKAILRALTKETTRLDAAIARARRQAELMQEYRARLIADVVTGKLDVRKAAARLPEEAEEVVKFQPRYFRDNAPALGE